MKTITRDDPPAFRDLNRNVRWVIPDSKIAGWDRSKIASQDCDMHMIRNERNMGNSGLARISPVIFSRTDDCQQRLFG